MTLCELAQKYGNTKGTKTVQWPCGFTGHGYTPAYTELFKDREVKNLLEIGIYSGSSLRMWEEYFPQAEIFGIDINSDFLINEGRIHSYQCNAHDSQFLTDTAVRMGGRFDVIIDDASHRPEDQILAANTLVSFLPWGGIYIIEDVWPHDEYKDMPADEYVRWIRNQLHYMSRVIECDMVSSEASRLIVIEPCES